MPRFGVKGGRAIYRDGEFFFSIYKSTDVDPCEADELTHIICALLNQLGDQSIMTTYTGDNVVLRLWLRD